MIIKCECCGRLLPEASFYNRNNNICSICKECTQKIDIKNESIFISTLEEFDYSCFTINVPKDTCLECGYTGKINVVCPVCGSKHIQ